ncbi:MAG TPA: hypothetical protein VN641_08470, partial [Urbifossiella sp.]|nr:hypothetical protein [Urbifossiella sp.]
MAAEPKSKASRAEVAERIAEVLRIRLDGAAFHDVVAYAKEKGWNVSERQCGRYLAQADDLLADRRDKSRKRSIALHLARRESLYARAVNAADYRTALAVLDSTAKMQNLFAGERELKELNSALKEKMRERGNHSRISLEEAKRIAHLAIAELPKPPTGPP